MFDWKNILIELAKKITTPLAFAVLLIVTLGQYGERIPAEYTRLVYAVGLGSLLIWALLELARMLRRPGRSRPGYASNRRAIQKAEPSKQLWVPADSGSLARSRALKTICCCRVSGERLVWVWRARMRRWRVFPDRKPAPTVNGCYGTGMNWRRTGRVWLRRK